MPKKPQKPRGLVPAPLPSAGHASSASSGGGLAAGAPAPALGGGRARRLGWGERIGRWPRLAQGVLWGAACALVMLLVGRAGRTQGIEGAALDVLFQTRNWRGPRYPSPNVAIVVVDEDTVAHYGQYPLPRRYFAQLVKYLKADGVRTIAFDIAFATRGNPELSPEASASGPTSRSAGRGGSGRGRVGRGGSGRGGSGRGRVGRGGAPSRDGLSGGPSQAVVRDPREEDRLFAVACGQAGNVVQAAAFYRQRDHDAPWSSQAEAQTTQPNTRFAWPDLGGLGHLELENALGAFSARPELQRTAAAIGHITVFPEEDYGTLRRIPHLIRFRERLYPSLALAASVQALGLSPKQVTLDGDNLKLGPARDAPRVPLQGQGGETLVNWIGGYESFATYPLISVLDHKVDPGTFRGKVVLVGAVNAGAFELRTTPFAAQQPAVEMQANAVDDILSGRTLREVPKYLQLLLLCGLPIGLGVLIVGRSSKALLKITLAALLGASGVALALFHANLYWPFASPLLAMGATALCCVAFRQAHDAAHLKTAQERYHLAVAAANDGIWDWDLASGEVYYAPRWMSLVGCAPSDLRPALSSWLDRVHPEDRGAVEGALSRHMEGRAPSMETEFRMQHRDGSWRWMLACGLMVRGEDGAPARMAGSLSDITARRLAEEKLRRQALSDELTGLPNRAFFLARLQKSIARAAQEPGFSLAVLFLDLDRFKIVNDSLGHMVGDEMLQAVARRLQSCLREGDVIARLGGDEFTLLIEGADAAHEATRQAVLLAHALQAALGAPLQIGGHDFSTTASIGIAIAGDGVGDAPQVLEHASISPDGSPGAVPGSGSGAAPEGIPAACGPRYAHAEEMLRDADTAMYRAKSAGRARCVVFDEAMHALALSQLRLETALRRAIEKEHLEVFFQPIIDLRPNFISAIQGGQGRAEGGLRGTRVSGFEALVRWRDPERGLVPPGEFVPFAEETGLIVPLDQWMLRAACRQTRAWMDAFGRDDLWVSVNLSGKRFEQAGLVESVQDALQESGLPPRCLRLEITESVVMGNAHASAQTLEQLKALGVSLAVDDFGTGYSSLSYLHQFPLDVLKIDRSFVMRISPGGGHGEIVQAVINLARSLSLSVVAEGVEHDYQAALLRALGCDYGQGFFFSRPVDAHGAAAMLAD